jgi:hypothetical protein
MVDPRCTYVHAGKNSCLPACVRTYNVGLSFALLLFLAFLTNFTMLSANFAFSILHHCMQPCLTDLQKSIAFFFPAKGQQFIGSFPRN